jgi:hypothetical protein
MLAGAPGKRPQAQAQAQAMALGLPGITWTGYLSFMFFAPLYLAGPLITAQDYFQQMATSTVTASMGKPKAVPSPAKQLQLRAALLRLAGWVGAVELARRMFYAPEVLLPHSASLWWVQRFRINLAGLVVPVTDQLKLADQCKLAVASSPALLGACRPWQVWFAVMCVLAAIWVQSVVPWALVRLCADSLGIQTADEAPASLAAATVSARTFWRNFHVSWHRWLLRYVYIPLGGGTKAAAAVMLVSTLLHGFHM